MFIFGKYSFSLPLHKFSFNFNMAKIFGMYTNMCRIFLASAYYKRQSLYLHVIQTFRYYYYPELKCYVFYMKELFEHSFPKF